MKHQRLLIGSILLLVLISLMGYYSLEHDYYDPDPRYIITHYQEFITTKAVLTGEVTAVDTSNHTLRIQVSASGITILVTTTEPLNTTYPGNFVELYGNFTNQTHMIADKLLIYEQWKNELIFIRSLPAIPFIVYLFFSTYRFNPDTRRFERRNNHG